MNDLYTSIIAKVVESGKRIRSKSGAIEDIGQKKRWLTEEDITIERNLKAIIHAYAPQHLFCAEEENAMYTSAEDVWVVDPISGTRSFINNTGAYGIVAAHLHKGEVVFSVVYDPKHDELFTAQKGKGALCNGEKLLKQEGPETILLRVSYSWKDEKAARAVRRALSAFPVKELDGSMAVTECQLAAGRCGGVICLTKDSYPHFASSLIVQETGYTYSNGRGNPYISFEDRIFVSGDSKMHKALLGIVQKYCTLGI